MDEVIAQLLEIIEKTRKDGHEAWIGYIAYRQGVATIWETLNFTQREMFCNAHNEVLEILGE